MLAVLRIFALAACALVGVSGDPWSRVFFGCNADPNDKVFHLEHVEVGGRNNSASADAANSTVKELRLFDMFGVYNYAADASSSTIAVVTSDGRVPNGTSGGGAGLQQYVRRFATATGHEVGAPLHLPLKHDGVDALDGVALHEGEIYGTRYCGPYGWYSGVYHVDSTTGSFTLMAPLNPFSSLFIDSFALDYDSGTYYFIMEPTPDSAAAAAAGGRGRRGLVRRGSRGLPTTPAPTPAPQVLFSVKLCKGCVNGTATQVVTQIDDTTDGGLSQPQFHNGKLWGFLSTRDGNRLAALDVSTGVVTRFPGGWAAPGYHSSDSSRLDAALGVLWATGSVDGRSKASYLAAVSLADGTLAHHFPLVEPLHYVAFATNATNAAA